MSADSKRDDGERELFEDAVLAMCVNSHQKDYRRSRGTHPLRSYVFLAVFHVQKLVISRGEHVGDDDNFGEEHDGEGDDVERSRRYHPVSRRAARRARWLYFLFSNGSVSCDCDVLEGVIAWGACEPPSQMGLAKDDAQPQTQS